MSRCDNIKGGEKNMEKIMIVGAVAGAIVAVSTWTMASI